MKVIFQSFIIISFSIFLSCKKKAIPKPMDPSIEGQAPLFYMSGNFNGEEQLKIVDGENYTVETSSGIMDDGSGGFISFWVFKILNINLNSMPEININLYTQHNNYEDLVSATDSTHINLLNVPGIAPTTSGFYERIEFNIPLDNQFYSSSFMDNSPLVINKSKDTIVNNKQYRIVELEGNLSLMELNLNTPYQISNFKARIAFGF